MKFLHISDLHLGKRIYEHSLLDDQRHILGEILKITDTEKPDAVFIAGDIYDKPIPGAEAVALFDEFLCSLASHRTGTFVISGNHDSAERIAFGSKLIDPSGIHLSAVFDGSLQKHTLTDEYGELGIYLLPFIRPADVRTFYPDTVIENTTDAVRAVIDAADIPDGGRSILIAHLFTAGACGAGSESTVSVGGSDMVDTAVFGIFNYTALGHIHRPQNVSDRIRYCGTPMKYDFSESEQEKSVTVGEIDAKGDVSIRTIPITPPHDMIRVKGSFDELMNGSEPTDDYICAILTDSDPIPDAAGRLRTVFRQLCELRYDNERTRLNGSPEVIEEEARPHIEIFAELYKKQNGTELDGERRDAAERVITAILEKEAGL